ncbi:MAG: SDR family NAD(P)-dependent oxidoreductase [Lautropia sp.]
MLRPCRSGSLPARRRSGTYQPAHSPPRDRSADNEQAFLCTDASPRQAKRIALVSGGTGALGGAICRASSQVELAVVALHTPGNTRVARWVDEQKTAGCQIHTEPVDVADYASCAAAVHAVRDRYGPIAILINNAGITRDRAALARCAGSRSHQRGRSTLNQALRTSIRRQARSLARGEPDASKQRATAVDVRDDGDDPPLRGDDGQRLSRRQIAAEHPKGPGLRHRLRAGAR